MLCKQKKLKIYLKILLENENLKNLHLQPNNFEKRFATKLDYDPSSNSGDVHVYKYL